MENYRNAYIALQDNQNTEFGSSKEHNRHFVVISVVLLVGALGVLYFFNFFGIFSITSSSGQLSEEKCMQLFGSSDVSFNQFDDGNKIIKQSNFVQGSSSTSFLIEEQHTSLKCYSKTRSNQTIFKSKGFGSGEYSCDNSHITYYGRDENGYFAISKETKLENGIFNFNTANPENTGVPEIDSQFPNLAGDTASIEVDFGDQNFIIENTFTNDKAIFDSEMDILRNKNCSDIFYLLS